MVSAALCRTPTPGCRRLADMDHPLIAAVKRGDVAEVVRARDACGDLSVVRSPNTENTALHIAAAIGNVEVLRALVPDSEKRTSTWHVDVRNKNRDTPLMHALAKAHVDAASCLLNSGARLDVVNEERTTPIHLAASSGEQKCVRLVLARRGVKNDADVNQACRFGRTALHYAACASVACVETLLEADANPFTRNAKGEVPAATAEHEGHPDEARALREAMRRAETAAAAAAASFEDEGETTRSGAKSSKKKTKAKSAVSSSGAEKPKPEDEDIELSVAPGWAAAFAENDAKENGKTLEKPEESPPKQKETVQTQPELKQKAVERSMSVVREPKAKASAPAPAPSKGTKSWASVATKNVPPPTVKISEKKTGARLTVPQDPPPSVSWEAEARGRLERVHPTAAALKVGLKNLLGLGVDEMSASQLEAAEEVHRELLSGLVDARVELARKTERALMEEAAAIERTITHMANSGVR